MEVCWPTKLKGPEGQSLTMLAQAMFTITIRKSEHGPPRCAISGAPTRALGLKVPAELEGVQFT